MSNPMQEHAEEIEYAEHINQIVRLSMEHPNFPIATWCDDDWQLEAAVIAEIQRRGTK